MGIKEVRMDLHSFLTDLENAKVQTRLKRRVYEEVRQILALLDDLEARHISLDEVKRRFQTFKEARLGK